MTRDETVEALVDYVWLQVVNGEGPLIEDEVRDAVVERIAPLQARIAELEEGLRKLAAKGVMDGDPALYHAALATLSGTAAAPAAGGGDAV